VHIQKVVGSGVLSIKIRTIWVVTYRVERFDVFVDHGVFVFAAFVSGEALGYLEEGSVFLDHHFDEGFFADAGGSDYYERFLLFGGCVEGVEIFFGEDVHIVRFPEQHTRQKVIKNLSDFRVPRDIITMRFYQLVFSR